MAETGKNNLREQVAMLPLSPGVYQFVDRSGTIIYVGKAKNLKRRVYSYFSKDHQSRKTAMLVSKIRDIKYIVVNSDRSPRSAISSSAARPTRCCSKIR